MKTNNLGSAENKKHLGLLFTFLGKQVVFTTCFRPPGITWPTGIRINGK
jgi:hypothetical protein